MAKKEDKSDILVTEEAKLTIGGMSPSVASVTIILKASSVPKAIITLAPGQDGDAPQDTATVPTLSDMHTWLDNLTQHVNSRSTASLSVKVKNTGGGTAESQEISLSGWIVTGAGLKSASASGGLALTVEISHPAAEMNDVICNLGGVVSSADMLVDTATSIVDAFSKGTENWLKKHREPKDVDRLAKDMARKAGKFNSLLTWEPSAGGSTWPLGHKALAPTVDLMPIVVGRYGSSGSGNMLQNFIGNVLSEFALAIIPTYWRSSLAVVPFNPWAKPAISIYHDEIASINMPGADVSPVIGTMMAITPDRTDKPGSWTAGEAEAKEDKPVAKLTVHFPDSDATGGSVVKVQVPSWLESLRNAVRASRQSKVSDTTINDGSETFSVDSAGSSSFTNATVKPTAGSGLSEITLSEAARDIVKQEFKILFKRDIEAGVTTPLLFKCDSKEAGYAVPGVVAEVRSEDGAMFLMYVTEVTHVIDIAGKTAYSSWNGSYCRPPGGYSKFIPENARNLYYE